QSKLSPEPGSATCTPGLALGRQAKRGYRRRQKPQRRCFLQGGDGRLVVGKPPRQRAIVAAVRIDRDGAAFGFNLLAKRERVKGSSSLIPSSSEKQHRSDTGAAQQRGSAPGEPARRSQPSRRPPSASQPWDHVAG